MGNPEQVRALSEMFRATARRGNVHLTFIDLQKAYDSVDHTIWHRCMNNGVDQEFPVLQAIYHHQATGMRKIDGRRLQGVPINDNQSHFLVAVLPLFIIVAVLPLFITAS